MLKKTLSITKKTTKQPMKVVKKTIKTTKKVAGMGGGKLKKKC